MEINIVKQNPNNPFYMSAIPVDWLVENTIVKTFDAKTFTGYQRQYDPDQARRIVKYINEHPFYFPSAIICSLDTGSSISDFSSLSVVDGQHRIEAFRIIKKENPHLYDTFKDYEIPVVILDKPKLNVEIDTFITINKTQKKVDTSLAYVLKNMLADGSTGEISNVARREYLAVEVARKLNSEEKSIWFEKILFEGSLKNRNEYITLNGFVKSMRALLGMLNKKHIISCNWDNTITDYQLNYIINEISDLVEYIWKTVYDKWPELRTNRYEDECIIQGTIGFTTINRYLITKSKSFNNSDLSIFRSFVYEAINQIHVPGECWKQGNIYSKLTSESGYSAIVDDLLGHGIH